MSLLDEDLTGLFTPAQPSPAQPKRQRAKRTVPKSMVRSPDYSTSVNAAAAVLPYALRIRQRVLLILYFHLAGLTDDEILEEVRHAVPVAESTPRKRRGELVEAGLVEASGVERDMVSGQDGTVWRITAAGIKEAEALLAKGYHL